MSKIGNKEKITDVLRINLSSCVEKLLIEIINNRLSKWLDKLEILKNEQTGLRSGNSVIDKILLSKEVMQILKSRYLFICFVDLSRHLVAY